jgi:hypothetical protein
MNEGREAALADLVHLHQEVERKVATLEAVLSERLRCGARCAGCCLDDLSVLQIEAERIRSSAAELLRQAPHPPGACAFLDPAGQCRIYTYRPYVCRTQGLPLRWFEEDENGEIRERRDICPLNLTALPLAALPEDRVWTLGPFEERLVDIQERWMGKGARRIRLRDLFV